MSRFDAADPPGEGRSNLRYLLRRAGIAVLALWVVLTLVFAAIHLGPRAPVEDVAGDNPGTTPGEERAALADKKERFGLTRPLATRYVDYLGSMATFEFGESWSSRWIDESRRAEPVTDVNRLVFDERLPQTLWLWGWTLAIALLVGVPLGVALGYSRLSWTVPGATVSGALLRALPVVMLVDLLPEVLSNSERLLFGFDWGGFLVEQYGFGGMYAIDSLGSLEGFLLASKQVFPFALVLATALIPSAVRLGSRAVRAADEAPWAESERARGVSRFRRVRRGLRRTVLPLVSVLSANVGVLIGGTLLVETHFDVPGVGKLFVESVGHGDYTTVQATMFLFVLLVVGTRLVENVLYVLLSGAPVDRDEAAAAYWTRSGEGWGSWSSDRGLPDRLRPLYRKTTTGLWGRIRANPRPAALWAGAGAALLALEFGAVLDAVEAVPLTPALPDLPTLTSRELLPNQASRTPEGELTGTAFGLSPAIAWALRAGLTYLYAAVLAGWAWLGYRIYRTTYRQADVTPVDEALGRLRGQRWGAFGAVVVFLFIVSAVFAPTLGPVPAAGGDTVEIFKEDSGVVIEYPASLVNERTQSRGTPDQNVGLLSYDRFDRFHPLGTSSGGSDMLSAVLSGARTLLVTGAVGTGVALGIALLGALLAGRFRGLLDGGTALGAELAAAVPVVPGAFLLLDQFEPVIPESGWVGTLALSVLVGVLLAPALWRTLRAPIARAFDAGWVEATRSFEDPSPRVLRRHVLPRVAGHVVAYGALAFVGVGVAIATVNGLWGGTVFYVNSNMISGGSARYVGTVSWHTAVVPSLATLLVLSGFVAFADGVRDAVDPEETEGVAAPGELAAAGGAG